MSRSDVQDAIQAATNALRGGHAAKAQALLAPVLAPEAGVQPPWLLVAQVAFALGDDDRAEAALHQILRIEARHLATLLLLASSRARRGHDRDAQSLYRLALDVAAQPGSRIEPAMVPMLQAGEVFLADVAKRYADHLGAAIATAGLGQGRAGARLRQSLDLLLGRQALYLQQPSMFYFPGLPQRAFYEREEFPWITELEAAVPAITRELQDLLAEPAGFAPYVQTVPGRAPPANPLLNNSNWSALYLWQAGHPVAANAERCPATMAALTAAPIPVIAARSPMALFSRLEPNTHIRPHHGLLNTRLICHLPLVVPDGCGLRVGAETRHWVTGETLIFDDSIEHEAWNRGTELRVVLLFEIWRPELTMAERDALTHIFETIDRYQGGATDTG